MKRLIIVLVLLIPLLGMARNNNPIDNLFRKYSNKDGVSSVNLGYFTLKFGGLVCKLAGHSEEAELIKNINGIRILTVEDKDLNKTLNFYTELKEDGLFKNSNYEVLMEVIQKDEVVRFIGTSGENGTLTDLVLIVGGRENSLISIRGLIDPKDIGKIAGSLNSGNSAAKYIPQVNTH